MQDASAASEEQHAGRGRGGRGRGRGAYGGGRGGASRGRGRGGFGGQARNEFEGDSDDDVYSAPTNKPVKVKSKKEDLKMDEDNYPTL